MSLRFVEKLRDELRFASLAELTVQMANDVTQTRYILAEKKFGMRHQPLSFAQGGERLHLRGTKAFHNLFSRMNGE